MTDPKNYQNTKQPISLIIQTRDGNVDIQLSTNCPDQMDVKDGGVAHVRLVSVTADDPPLREVMEEKRRQHLKHTAHI